MITTSPTEAATDLALPHRADQPGSQPAGAHLVDGSRELVEELRSRLADHDAAAAQHRERLAAELTRQEALWSANEAARLRHLAVATVDYEAARTTYETLAAAAADAMAQLYEVSCRAAVLFKAALRAELAKREAIPALESARRTIRDLAEDVTDPVTATLQEFEFSAHDPRLGIAQTALEVFPELRSELARLRSLPQGPTEQTRDREPRPRANRHAPSAPGSPLEQAAVAPDQLETLFRHSHAKRERDDQPRQVTA